MTQRVFWSEEDEGYIAVDDERPGCSAFGVTAAAALAELVDARLAWDEAKHNIGK